MNIILDGHQFVLAPGTSVVRAPIVEWPDNIRFDGQQKRKDRRYMSSWAIDNWSGGLGKERIITDADLNRLWDAENVDTRWSSQIVLSPAFVTCTIVPSRADLTHTFVYLNNVYFAEANSWVGSPINAAGSGYSLPIAYQFSAPNTIGSNSRIGQIFTAESGTNRIGSLAGIGVYGDNLAFVFSYYNATTGSQYNLFDSVSALNGNTLKTIGSLNNLSSSAVISHPVRFGNMGGTVHILDLRRSQNKVGFWTANQAMGGLTQVASLSAVVGSYLASLESDGLTMYANLPDGIYDFDITPSIIVDTAKNQDLNCNQALFGQNLFFKNQYSLIKYLQNGSSLTPVGYDLEDGLPSDKWGQITAMTSTNKWLFVAVKGATYSHILTRDTLGAWQYYARIPSAGLWIREMLLTNAPDAIDRLWIQFDNAPGVTGYFLNPVVNPLQAGTYSFVPTGYFTPPIFDGGISEVQGGFFNNALNGKALGGSNNITAFYGLDSSSPTVQLGITATTTDSLTFGSPAGISGYRIQPKYQLAGAIAGTSPVLNSAIIQYLKDPTKRDMFDLTIDYNETARSFGLDIEGLIATMDAIRDIKTLIPFHYGLVATRYVKVLDVPGNELIQDDKILGGNREGLLKLRLVEIKS